KPSGIHDRRLCCVSVPLKCPTWATSSAGSAGVVNLVLCCKWRTFKDAAPGVIALVVTGIVAVRRGSAWTIPGLKVVPGVAQVLAVVCGLACRLKVKMKAFDSAPAWLPAGRCFVGQ